MKRRVLIAVLLGTLVAPAAAYAQTGTDRANAARACKALRTSLGPATFAVTYGTARTNRRDAMGRCVSQWTRTERQNRVSAQAACNAERNDANFAATHGGKTFQQFYGTGPNGRNAFGRCVSSKARAASAEQRQNTMTAARQCKTERQTIGVAAFRAKYGKNENDRNAFGKCVSMLAKAQNS